MLRLRIFSCLILLGPSLLFSQSNQSLIDASDLKRHVQVLSSDSLEGRAPGSSGLYKAQDYIVREFQNLGLKPGMQDSYLERISLEKRYLGETYLKIGDNKLMNFEEVIFMPSVYYQNDEIQKEVVFGGYGSDEELDAIDVIDRFVVVFIENLMAHSVVGMELNKRGAFGMIAVKSSNDVQQISLMKRIFKDHNLKKNLVLIDNPQARVDTIQKLKSYVLPVRTVIIPRSVLKQMMGISAGKLQDIADDGQIAQVAVGNVSVKIEWIVEKIETNNVVALIPGKSNKKIIISAHYDHLGMKGGEIHPGADDNATGVAAMLQLAKSLSQKGRLNYDLLFLATTAEEASLLGSKYHVGQPSFDAKEVLMNINIDMIGRIDHDHNKADYLYVLGTDQSDSLHDVINMVDESDNEISIDYSLDKTSEFGGLYSRSDQISFYKKGILSIFFFSGIHDDYHSPGDTWDKINYRALENRVRFIESLILKLQ